MKKKVMFMMIDVIEGNYPLVPSYLTEYASLDSEIRKYWDFECRINLNIISPDQLESDMLENKADVYAFSCYLWNMDLIKKTLRNYLEKKPTAHIILGGPQVTHQAKKYLSEKYENLVICNGEGEKIFKNYLKELMKEHPDFNNIKGLSFYRQNSLITTPDEKHIENLDELPSPFKSPYFDKQNYLTVDIEISRGCPFSCKYCRWSSGRMGCKPARFSDERIKADISRVVRKGIDRLSVADSNFGFFPQDLEIAKFIATCKKDYGYPKEIITSPSRNNYQRVIEIAEIFREADINYSFEVSMQTLNDLALKRIGRKNDIESYIKLITALNNKGIASFIELIWPLPGETLDSFKQGIATLCKIKSSTFIVYPFVFMNNIAMQNNIEEYGIVMTDSQDINHEAKIVIRTNEVSYEDYIQGLEFIFATVIIHCLRSLFATANYLNDSGLEKYEILFCKFVNFVKSKTNIPGAYWLKKMENEKSVGFSLYIDLTHAICHKQRDEFDNLLAEFVSSQFWWTDKTAQLFFEVDLLNRGYLFSGTVTNKHYPFRHLKILKTSANGYIVEIPSLFAKQIKEKLGIKASFNANCVEINHRQSQFPFDEQLSQLKIEEQCFQMYYNPYSALPEWRDAKKESILSDVFNLREMAAL